VCGSRSRYRVCVFDARHPLESCIFCFTAQLVWHSIGKEEQVGVEWGKRTQRQTRVLKYPCQCSRICVSTFSVNDTCQIQAHNDASHQTCICMNICYGEPCLKAAKICFHSSNNRIGTSFDHRTDLPRGHWSSSPNTHGSPPTSSALPHHQQWLFPHQMILSPH